jgi:hypothetical protein
MQNLSTARLVNTSHRRTVCRHHVQDIKPTALSTALVVAAFGHDTPRNKATSRPPACCGDEACGF